MYRVKVVIFCILIAWADFIGCARNTLTPDCADDALIERNRATGNIVNYHELNGEHFVTFDAEVIVMTYPLCDQESVPDLTP